MRGAAYARTAARRRGFTLVELLVAIAIFVTVMASVALVFNGAVRTSKQGFQNQEAYELARGAMKVIERDLSRAFTNRNRGDVFNFYGTPIGFTYVGLIYANESSAPNMARVTYVIRHLTPTLDNVAGSIANYETKDGNTIPTYQLIRYIEPGADTLDSFPVDWTQQVFPDSGAPITLNTIVNAAVVRSGCGTSDTACGDLIRQAARRELWILMLSGGGDLDLDGDGANDTSVPGAWDTGAWNAIPSFANRDPADYVVAESVRYLNYDSLDITLQPWCAADQDALYDLLEASGRELDFDDIVYQNANGQTCAMFVGNANAPPVFDGTTRAIYSPSDGPRPFFTYWDIGVREMRFDQLNPANDDPLNTITSNDKVNPIAFQFWNDWRNLLQDGIDNNNNNQVLVNDGADNDGDGAVDEPLEGVDEPDEALLQFEDKPGSPLDTRLPIAVTIDFTLFFRSPYPGAPDFNERFTQRIDLPTAYRRTIEQRVQDQTP